MRYFLIDQMPRRNAEFCFIRSFPENMGLHTYKLKKGIPVGTAYPADARIYMDDKEPGIELPSLIGNTRRMLIVERAMKEAIERLDPKPIEILPVSIYNHKKRLASADYFIINPIGTHDCLDLEESEIKYHEGKVVSVDVMVLRSDKLRDVPALFRVPEAPMEYLISEALLDEWRALQPRPTNISLIEVECAP